MAGIARDDLSRLNQLQSQSVNSDAIVAIGLDGDTDGLEGCNSLNRSAFTADRSSLMWSHDGSALYDPNPAAIGASFKINVARGVEVGPVQMYQLNGVTASSTVQRSGDQLIIQPKGLKGGVYLLMVMLYGQCFEFRLIIR